LTKFVEIASAGSVHELSVLRSLLEANDILTFIQDEYINQLRPSSYSKDKVKLSISELDVQKAYEVIKDNNLLYLTDFDQLEKHSDNSDNLFTEWTIFGNYPPIKMQFIIYVVIISLIALILFSIYG
jgi:hypothetical protein